MKERISEPIKRMAKNLLFHTPSNLLEKQTQIDKDGLHAIEKSLRENYHIGWRSESKYSNDEYRNDLVDHLYRRLQSDRLYVVPWLDNASTLQGKRILEIGCGTGSSTVAIAEQGAKVIGIDIDEGALSVAKERAEIYGVDAEFMVLSGDKIANTFCAAAFDFVIFFASLEHMSITERLASLKAAWAILPNGGVLVIVETPNRLWYFDEHTSMLPFFHWLPNELAFQYSRFSSRQNFGELYKEYNTDTKAHFLRRGRGMSFHELDIAIGPARDLKVISSLSTFQGIRYNLRKPKLYRKYKSILMRIYEGIHEGFFDDYLYLIVKKQ